MGQIEVPEEEALAALDVDANQRKSRVRKFHYKWGEIFLSGVVVICLFFIGTLMWPKTKEISDQSSSVSTEEPKKIPANILQATKYWKIANEDKYYSFSNDDVRMIINYFTWFAPKYTFRDDQLDIYEKVIDDNNEVIAELHSYQVAMDGSNLILEPKLSEVKRLVLEPHNEEIFPYTEESLKKLRPANEPDLTAYSSWTSIIKGNDGLNSTVTFDGFIRKEKIDGEDSWLTMTYEVNGNHILVNYGGYKVGADMYWDGENIVFWPVSNSLQKSEDRKEYAEESVTLLKPNK
ncbi:hypothetical protein RV15_GL000449 [Enterococcus silesiacus]|nr:hypothetical protein RV15_GL000449 [Enterococcus silesiacus]